MLAWQTFIQWQFLRVASSRFVVERPNWAISLQLVQSKTRASQSLQSCFTET